MEIAMETMVGLSELAHVQQTASSALRLHRQICRSYDGAAGKRSSLAAAPMEEDRGASRVRPALRLLHIFVNHADGADSTKYYMAHRYDPRLLVTPTAAVTRMCLEAANARTQGERQWRLGCMAALTDARQGRMVP